MFPVTTDVYLTENHYEPLSLNLIPISKISCPGSRPIVPDWRCYRDVLTNVSIAKINQTVLYE